MTNTILCHREGREFVKVLDLSHLKATCLFRKISSSIDKECFSLSTHGHLHPKNWSSRPTNSCLPQNPPHTLKFTPYPSWMQSSLTPSCNSLINIKKPLLCKNSSTSPSKLSTIDSIIQPLLPPMFTGLVIHVSAQILSKGSFNCLQRCSGAWRDFVLAIINL